MVHLWFMEDFNVEDKVEEEALDEEGVRSYVIIVAKPNTIHEIIIIPLTLHVTIIDSLTM